MSETSKSPNLIHLLFDLQHDQSMQRQSVDGKSLPTQLALLRAWQSRRLSRTYADLSADPQFGPACRFFLSDIYAPRDFSQRDHDFERLHDLLSRFLPAQMLRLLHDAIQLNRLSYALDNRLLEALVNQPGVTQAITPEQYAEAYRLCDNYARRAAQIEQLADILTQVGEGTRLPMVGVSLRLARIPAQAAGWFELYDFLARGYTAFKPMRRIHTFARTIRDRETRILDRIYARHPHPFDL
jgi:hypothetical protein